MEAAVIEKKETKLVPKLRFPEFNDNWEKRKLSDFLSFKNGINANKEDYGRGYKFINILDIINNDYLIYNKIVGQVNISKEIFDKNIVEYGDILFQRSSETREEVGQSNVYLDKSQNVTFGGFVIRGKRINDYNPMYMNFLLKTDKARKEMIAKSGGSTRYNIGQETLKGVQIHMTGFSQEQQKIASFLSTIETKIQQLQRKKELLVQYKKGVMQQVFSQQIRFKPALSEVEGEDDGSEYPKWEEKRFGDIGKFIGGGTPSSDIESYWNGNVPWISSSDLDENSINKISITRHITNIAIEKSATKIIPKGSLVIVSRVGVGKFAVAPENLCTSQDFTNLISDQNTIFLAYYLSHFKSLLFRLCQGTSIKGFTGKDLGTLKIGLPIIQEQQKIADFLSAIDDKIDKTVAQIEITQRFKKGLLQQMFV
ncbi:hypothetical protein GCM10009430_24470 [Aquimarina litoralis]|uniref:Type I restriction modification DNA specificity domain-containing protein n=1 Tax=Aquimarina litoralis TaxID=584605 RepID=A0ABP3U4K6_9FLAO